MQQQQQQQQQKEKEKVDWRNEVREFERKIKLIKDLLRIFVPIVFFVLAGCNITNALANFPESIHADSVGVAVVSFGCGILYIHIFE